MIWHFHYVIADAQCSHEDSLLEIPYLQSFALLCLTSNDLWPTPATHTYIQQCVFCNSLWTFLILRTRNMQISFPDASLLIEKSYFMTSTDLKWYLAYTNINSMLHPLSLWHVMLNYWNMRSIQDSLGHIVYKVLKFWPLPLLQLLYLI